MNQRRTQPSRSTARATLGALGVLAVMLGMAAPGAALSRGPDPEGGGAADQHLRLVEQTAWTEPDGEMALRLQVDDAPPGSTIEITMHDRLTGRIQFAESLDGEGLGPVVSRKCGALVDTGFVALDPCIIPVDTAQIDDDGAITVGLAVRSSSDGPADRIQLSGDGVYPLRISLADADGIPIDTLVTHLLRLPDDGDDSPPLAVSMIIPFRAPIARQPDGSLQLDPAAVGQIDGVIDAIDQHPDVPIALVPTPETLRALDEGTATRAGVERLGAALTNSEVLAQPYVPVDVGSWWSEDLDEELDDLLDTGATAAEDTLGVESDAATWLIEPTTDPDTLARLRSIGVSQVVVPEEQLLPLDEALFPLALDRPFVIEAGDGARVPAVMDDQALRSHAGSTGDPVLDAHHLLADLLLLYTQQPGIPRGVAFSVPETELDPTFLEAVLSGLDQPAPVRAATVPDLLASADSARVGGSSAREGEPLVRPVLTTAPAGLGAYPEMRQETIETLVPYRALVGETADLSLVDELIRVSGAVELNPTEQADYLEGATAQVASAATAVTTPAQDAVTLTAREGRIPIVVRNELDQPIEVVVRLESDKLEYPDGQDRLVTLEPGDNRLEWLVRSRASGAFPVDVVVTSPDGSLELASTRFTMRSTAVSGIGVGLSVIAALFLAVWWARHWHSSRRAARLVNPGDTEDTQGSAAADERDRVIDEITRV